MKILRVLPVCALLVLICGGLAKADTVTDASIIIQQGMGSTELFGPIWSFMSPTGTNINFFVNKSGEKFISVTITIDPPFPPGPFNCGVGLGTFFSNCTVTGGGNSPLVFFFFGGPGISAVNHFEIDVSGWNANTTFNAVANPEPATLSLLLLGLGGMAVRRRFRA